MTPGYLGNGTHRIGASSPGVCLFSMGSPNFSSPGRAGEGRTMQQGYSYETGSMTDILEQFVILEHNHGKAGNFSAKCYSKGVYGCD